VTTLPEWLVERAALDEVPAASRARLAGADPDELAARIAAIRERDAAELRSHPPGQAVEQIEQAVARTLAGRAAARRRSRPALVAAAAALVVGLVIIGVVSGRRSRPDPISPSAPAAGGDPVVETTRIKGDARLLAFRKQGGRVERLAPGAIVRAGDVVQLRFNGGGRRHGVIASIDGSGVVTLHFPDSEIAATDLPEKTADLPHAYALDDAPRFERFFFITAEEPIDVASALGALRTLAGRPDGDRAALALPPSFRQVSLLLHKAPPR
jgi:hypothetical protein